MRLPRASISLFIQLLLIAVLVGVLIAGFTVLAAQWVAVASAVVPILIFFVSSVQGRRDNESPGERASRLAGDLAAQVLADWKAELPIRGLEERRRMAVRWRLAEGSNPGAGLAESLPEGGVLEELTGAIGAEVDADRLPRLVITGAIGGGKTAACVLLVVELAERHTRLPVLFQLAAWDPDTSLRDWMAGQLPEIYPSVGEGSYGRRVAEIMTRRHILPILDGLDEVNDPAKALRAIDEELAGRPFVMTCRTAEFEASNSGHVLHQAVITELQPLRPDEVISVLEAYEPSSVNGPLGSLQSDLAANPKGPLSEALSTPFMVSLARSAGVAHAELPQEADGIRQYLLGAFVRQAYLSDDPLLPAQRAAFPHVGYEQARFYLSFLAEHADVAGRLAWWRLYRTVPRVQFLILGILQATVACSGLAAGFFALFGRPWLGFWIGFVVGVIGALVVELIPVDDPRRTVPTLRPSQPPTKRELARIGGFGFMGAAALAAGTLVLYGPVEYTVTGAVLSGFTYALARYISQRNDPLKVVTPERLMRADRVTVFNSWLVGAVPGALTGFYLGYRFHDGHRASLGALYILRYPSLELALLGAIGGCVLSSAGLGLMAMGASAWGRFFWARVFLAFRHRTPLRLMTFLHDAHHRGILREVNGYYEFRHHLLRQYLR